MKIPAGNSRYFFMHKRISLAFFGLIITFGILISNLGIIAFNANNSPVSQNRSRKSLTISTSRGMIYDTNMKKIVKKVIYFFYI